MALIFVLPTWGVHFNRIFHYKPSSYWGIPIFGSPHITSLISLPYDYLTQLWKTTVFAYIYIIIYINHKSAINWPCSLRESYRNGTSLGVHLPWIFPESPGAMHEAVHSVLHLTRQGFGRFGFTSFEVHPAIIHWHQTSLGRCTLWLWLT